MDMLGGKNDNDIMLSVWYENDMERLWGWNVYHNGHVTRMKWVWYEYVMMMKRVWHGDEMSMTWIC